MLDYVYIRRIKALQRQMCIDEDTYREMLSGYGVATCKDLSKSQSLDLIGRLDTAAGNTKPHHPRRDRRKYDNLADRRGDMATPRQLRMIEAMWFSHSRVRQKTDVAFLSFIKRICSVDAIAWVTKDHIRKVVKAMKEL